MKPNPIRYTVRTDWEWKYFPTNKCAHKYVRTQIKRAKQNDWHVPEYTITRTACTTCGKPVTRHNAMEDEWGRWLCYACWKEQTPIMTDKQLDAIAGRIKQVRRDGNCVRILLHDGSHFVIGNTHGYPFVGYCQSPSKPIQFITIAEKAE